MLTMIETIALVGLFLLLMIVLLLAIIALLMINLKEKITIQPPVKHWSEYGD